MIAGVVKERLIHRSEYADYYERNRTNTIEKEHLYKRSQSIDGHPNGPINRSTGFCYVIPARNEEINLINLFITARGLI